VSILALVTKNSVKITVAENLRFPIQQLMKSGFLLQNKIIKQSLRQITNV